jgi:hypothetical protein
MPDIEKEKTPADADALTSTPTGPLVFISHDSRDADLAEAFSKLFKSVSAGMIKTFRSSDKKGNDGIDFGDEWYKRLMAKLQSTSDVVCLFTERSLDRPWILFEAGVAKGKLGTPVIGVALGVPLNRVTTGPFYQFQNMDDSEADLAKLVNQFARRVPNLELDADVVSAQVKVFKAAEATLLKSAASAGGKKAPTDGPEESAVAKLVEEMKSLPSRVAERLAEDGESFRGRKMRRFHPMMFEDLMRMSGGSDDPVAILMAASVMRDEAPWLYELAMEVYRAVKTGDAECIQREMKRLRRFSETMREGPWMREFGSKDSYMFTMEFPHMLQHMLSRTLERQQASEAKKSSPRKRIAKSEPGSE